MHIIKSNKFGEIPVRLDIVSINKFLKEKNLPYFTDFFEIMAETQQSIENSVLLIKVTAERGAKITGKEFKLNDEQILELVEDIGGFFGDETTEIHKYSLYIASSLVAHLPKHLQPKGDEEKKS